MGNKKDIGSLFKEKLNQLDKSPNDNGWIAIQNELDKKKKRRIIPFWFFFLSSIVCGFLGYYSFHQMFDSVSPQIEYNNKTNKKLNNPNAINDNVDSIINLKKNNAAATDLNLKEAKTNLDATKSSEANGKSGSKSKNTFEKNSSISKRKSNKLAKTKNTSKLYRSNKNNVTKSGNHTEENNEKLALNSNRNDVLTNEKTAGETFVLGEKYSNNKEKESSITQKDSIAKKVKPTVKKENLIDSTKTETPAIESNALVFSPYFGYTYTRILGNSSNTFTGTNMIRQGIEISPNYGIIARWMGTKNIGIQTGFGFLQFNRFSEIEKNGAFFIGNSSIRLNDSNEALEAVFANATKIKIRQKVSFYEVPLELYFLLSDKKFGIATTVGMSFIFIHKNTVDLESDTVNQFAAGESTDISKQSFTGNAKLNFFYHLNSKIQLNLYPEIQFQFMGNPDRSTDYVPYFISLKTGFTYKF